MALEKRDTQTEVKHQILVRYMDAWAGIIINGLAWRKVRSTNPRFVYVDGFSSRGRYLGDTGDLIAGRPIEAPTWGSPILGIQALDRAQAFARNTAGYEVGTTSILIEEKRDRFQTLCESLDLAGFTPRVDVNPKEVAPESGRITVIHGDFHDYLDRILAAMGEAYAWSSVFLDPYGPTGDLPPIFGPRIMRVRPPFGLLFRPSLLS